TNNNNLLGNNNFSGTIASGPVPGTFFGTVAAPATSLLVTVTVNVTGINDSPRVDIQGTQITTDDSATTDEDINIRLGTGAGPTAGIIISDAAPTPPVMGPASTQIDS